MREIFVFCFYCKKTRKEQYKFSSNSDFSSPQADLLQNYNLLSAGDT